MKNSCLFKKIDYRPILNKHRRQLMVENNKVAIKQATKQGYIECEVVVL